MLEKLKQYSEMVRRRRQELGYTCAELCVKARISTKTLDLIENEKWPKNGKLSDWQKRGQGKCILGLADVLGFNAEEWVETLGLARYKAPLTFFLKKEDLEYLLQIVELTGQVKLSTALDLLSQRKI